MNEKLDIEQNKTTEPEKTFWAAHREKINAVMNDPEKSPDEKAAEIAGMKRDYFLKRFEIPLDDENDERERFVTNTGPWDKIESILAEGLISEKYARRIGKEDYLTMNKSFYESRGITPDEVFVNSAFVNPWAKDHPVFIIDPNIDLDYSSDGASKSAKFRIAPRHFLALLLPEGAEEDLDSFDIKGARAIFHDDPSKAIPVMTYQAGEETVVNPANNQPVSFFRFIPKKELYPGLDK